MERMNVDQIAHSLSLCGMPAYRATILNLVAGMNELQEQVEELQGLVSEEMMAGLAQARRVAGGRGGTRPRVANRTPAERHPGRNNGRGC